MIFIMLGILFFSSYNNEKRVMVIATFVRNFVIQEIENAKVDELLGHYRIQPNDRPCPHNSPPSFFLLYFHLLSPT